MDTYIYVYIGTEEEQTRGNGFWFLMFPWPDSVLHFHPLVGPEKGRFLLSLPTQHPSHPTALLGDSLLAQTIFPSFLDSDWPILVSTYESTRCHNPKKPNIFGEEDKL
jgi:hypothetical protein